MLCAPTVEDVLPTIRSRTRLVTLTTPTAADVADFLERRHGVPADRASYAARASQGHIGRARALARDDEVRDRRDRVVAMPADADLPRRLPARRHRARRGRPRPRPTRSPASSTPASGRTSPRPTAWSSAVAGPGSTRPRSAALEKGQKTRAKRRHLDVVDRALMDLVSVYRDAIAVAAGAPGELVNEERRAEIERLAAGSSAELNLRRIGWIFDAREQMLEFNVPVPLALESMMLALKLPDGARR